MKLIFQLKPWAVIEDSNVYLTAAEWKNGRRPLTPPPRPTGCQILSFSVSFYGIKPSKGEKNLRPFPLLFLPTYIYDLILSALKTPLKEASWLGVGTLYNSINSAALHWENTATYLLSFFPPPSWHSHNATASSPLARQLQVTRSVPISEVQFISRWLNRCLCFVHF